MFGEIFSPIPWEGMLVVPSGCPPARRATGDARAALPILGPVPLSQRPLAEMGTTAGRRRLVRLQQALGALDGFTETICRDWDLHQATCNCNLHQCRPPTAGQSCLTRESSFPGSWKDPKDLHLFNLKT